MTWTWLDLLLFTGAVYGVSWTLTKSVLLRRVREALANVPLVGKLVQCVVCTATWVALALTLLLDRTTLFSQGFRAGTVADAAILVAWTVASSWGLARLLGDAD